MTRIQIICAGMEFTADPVAEAPATLAAFSKLLPYRQKLIHVRWSGEAVWAPLGDFQLGEGFENHTSQPSVGDVLFQPGGYSFASKMGPLAGNHFLRTTEGREQLPQLGRLALWHGAQDVLFEALDDPAPKNAT